MLGNRQEGMFVKYDHKKSFKRHQFAKPRSKKPESEEGDWIVNKTLK